MKKIELVGSWSETESISRKDMMLITGRKIAVLLIGILFRYFSSLNLIYHSKR